METLKTVLSVLAGIIVFCSVVHARARYAKRFSRLRTREQLLISAFVLVLSGLIVGGIFLWRNWYYTPAPAPYSTMEQAEADGCIVINAPAFLERGKEQWEQFYGMTNFGFPATITIAVWDGGESQAVNTLLFDGELYHYTTHNGLKHHAPTTKSYPYLLFLRYEPTENDNKLYRWMESYVLTDKANLTGEELANRLYGEDAEFTATEIVSIYEWKETP